MREGFYEKHGVKVLVGERAITINRQEKVIHPAPDVRFYDKLIMATGSYPWIPPIKGSETQIASFTVPLKTSTPLNPAHVEANAARLSAVVCWVWKRQAR